MPNPRHSSKSPVKAQAFALSSVRPPQQQGAWRPPPVYCADGVTLYQDYVRAPPGQVGFALNTSHLENLKGWESLRANDGVDDKANYITPVHSDAVAAPTAHSVAQEKQTTRWVTETIPALLPGYVDLMLRTECLRHLDRATPYMASCVCAKQKEIRVYLLRWHNRISLQHCACRPGTQQLVARGFFPSLPVEPHLGVDIRVLDFAQDLFLNQAPNNRALTKTIEQCLDRLGYKLPNHESLRRQFGNALEYYVMLRHSTDQAIDNILATVRQRIQNEDNNHECPTTPANIKTPSERQFYMFALLEALFQHLPTDFAVGFLHHAIAVLAECPHSVSVLCAEHTKQVATLSQPLPRQSKHAGKIAIQDVLRKTVAMDRLKNQMSQWNDAIYKEDADPVYVDFAVQEYAKANAKLLKLAESVRKQKAIMGVEDKANLSKLVKSKYIQARTNAAAAKTKLRNRLRQRKFELDRVERHFHRNKADAKMMTHIEDAVRRRDQSIKDVCRLYNRLCTELQELIRLGRAPRNAIAPRQIIEKDIWGLDVDAEIWLDVGLSDADEDTEPPLWMKSDTVCQGIQAMLEQDRCNEEEPRLFHESRALRWWMAEEWEVLTRGIKLAAEDGEAGIVYQFKLRKSELTKLTAAWEKPLRQVPYPTVGLPAWGLSDEDLLQVRINDMFARTMVGSWKESDWSSHQEDSASDSDSGTDTEYFPYDELDAFERAGDWRELHGI
ncbi:unnamed protein product [Mycena citricolor]|uniref:CxC1-like cysteine cluster associated with KDZ transposases domain-containing protein n=1 Tax=Mycena citricolor TaxID=2018698 RepID=A0AAD2K7N2_9AGAR|nr:unnamed protein product [Mycena citricolor]